MVTNADLRAYLTFPDGHPLVVELAHATAPTTHNTNIAHVLALGPVACIVNKVWIQLFRFDRVL